MTVTSLPSYGVFAQVAATATDIERRGGTRGADRRPTYPISDPGVLVTHGVPFGSIPLPAGVEVLRVRVSVGELTALHAAPASRRTRGTVVLVPGLTGSKEDFMPLLPLLAEDGWDAWALSQRGQADSAAPDGADAYSLDNFSRDALEVADVVGVGGPVHLVGHSFGGVIAQVAATRAPAAFLDLTILCSGPRGFPDTARDLRGIAASGGSMGVWRADNSRLIDVDPASFSRVDAFRYERARRTSSDQIRGALDILWDPMDRTPALRQSGVRAMVAHGEADAAWPQDWQRDMAAALDAPYRVIPDAGHYPAEENPVATAVLLDSFWSGQSG